MMTSTEITPRTTKSRDSDQVGETLFALLERLGERPRTTAELEWLLGIVLQVCDDTISAHGHGRMHCDIEPGNVLIDRAGKISMADASLSLAPDRGPEHRPPPLPREGDTLGTTEYMAPEQAWSRRGDFDARTDVYGIGGIMYAILTRTAPHCGASARAELVLARGGTIRAPKDVCPERSLPPELCRIALRALSAAPSARHPTVALLKQDIERFLSTK